MKFKKILQESVPVQELERAKAQIKAGILMSRESMMSRANRQAKHTLNMNKALDIQHLVEQIESVNPADIQAVAGDIFNGLPTLAGLGPLQHLEPLDAIQKRLAA